MNDFLDQFVTSETRDHSLHEILFLPIKPPSTSVIVLQILTISVLEKKSK